MGYIVPVTGFVIVLGTVQGTKGCIDPETGFVIVLDRIVCSIVLGTVVGVELDPHVHGSLVLGFEIVLEILHFH